MILLIFPFQAELEAFLSGMTGRTETKVRGIRLFSVEAEPEWRLAVCGQGKVEAALATQILSDALEPRALMLLGSATALDPSLIVGDIVMADPGIEWDFDADKAPEFRMRRPFPEPRRTLSGPILSGDKDVFDPAQKAELFERFGAKALAWEGAGFHRYLRRSGKTGWEVRVITEEAKEGRLTLAALKERMATDFPSLRPVVRAAMF
ncbi:MAG: methylthioadenosine nucleosidase [Fibrobacteres bacterium]|nr:methylthioadenosine nucleosidase [Fibrobacterota bacterium]